MTSPDWIKNLKPGDRVAVTIGHFHGSEGQIYPVVNTTPSGRITVQIGASKVVFNPNGRERGDSRGWRVAQLTPELEAAIREREERSRLLRTLESTRWRDLPLETLRAVAALLPEKETE